MPGFVTIGLVEGMKLTVAAQRCSECVGGSNDDGRIQTIGHRSSASSPVVRECGRVREDLSGHAAVAKKERTRDRNGSEHRDAERGSIGDCSKRAAVERYARELGHIVRYEDKCAIGGRLIQTGPRSTV